MTFFPAVVVLGLGMAITVAPLTTTVMGAVSESQAGIASGINNAVARTAGLLSIALLSIALLRAFNYNLDRRLANLSLTAQVQQALDAQRIKLAGAEIPAGLTPDLTAAIRQAIATSFVDSFRLVIFISIGLALASALIAALMLKPKRTANRT